MPGLSSKRIGAGIIYVMSTAWGSGSTTAWRKLRLEILARDGFECQIRIPGEWTTRAGEVRRCLGAATQVHHILGKGVTGDDPRYLEAACQPCNLFIGSPEDNESPQHRVMTQW